MRPSTLSVHAMARPTAQRRTRVANTTAAGWIVRMLSWALGALMLVGMAPGYAEPASPDYPPVVPGRVLAFPQDFGAHPDYRTEWWYITGWLRDAAGVERGFQLTFFRVRTRIGEDNPSVFAPRQPVLAHGSQVRSARDERDCMACAGQKPAEIAANSAGAHDRDSHA